MFYSDGSVKGLIKASRGLRQGDLLSPYLLTLVTEQIDLQGLRKMELWKVSWWEEIGLECLCYIWR